MTAMESDLVVVRTCVNKFEADVALSALTAAGIEAIIRADDCGGLRPGLWMGGVAVLVRAADAKRARGLLAVKARGRAER